MKLIVVRAQVHLVSDGRHVGSGDLVEANVHHIEKKEWAAKVQLNLQGLIETTWIAARDVDSIDETASLMCVVTPHFYAGRSTALRPRALNQADDVIIECYDTEQEAMDT